jgi:hypothetical protein
VRANGGDQEEAEGDAADLQVLSQRVGDVGPTNRLRHPHDRGAPTSTLHVHPVVVVMVMVVVVMAVAVAAVSAGREEQGAPRDEERRSGGQSEGFGRGAAAAEVGEGRGPREAEEVRGRRHRRGDRGGGREELHRGAGGWGRKEIASGRWLMVVASEQLRRRGRRVVWSTTAWTSPFHGQRVEDVWPRAGRGRVHGSCRHCVTQRAPLGRP